MFATYIALCADGSLYVGITNNVPAREKRHNEGTGSYYTKLRRPVRIVYTEFFQTRKEAAHREQQLKGWTRRKKLCLIQGIKPES